jgi:hypothetical protein
VHSEEEEEGTGARRPGEYNVINLLHNSLGIGALALG